MSHQSSQIDIDKNCASLRISREIYLRILQKAVMQTTQDIKSFETALPTGDFEKIKALTHKFKGDYDNLRITEMSSLAKEMEEVAKTTQDKEHIAGLLNKFQNSFEHLAKIIQNGS